jgi:hypothetical protein
MLTTFGFFSSNSYALLDVEAYIFNLSNAQSSDFNNIICQLVFKY